MREFNNPSRTFARALRRDYYAYSVAITAILLQFFVYRRVYCRVYPRHHIFSDAWIISNFLLLSLALLLRAPVLRAGRGWQRACALLLCLIPAWMLLDRIVWSINMLAQP